MLIRSEYRTFIIGFLLIITSLFLTPDMALSLFSAMLGIKILYPILDTEERFEKDIEIKTNVEELFEWHEKPGAFERLTPTWDPVKIIKKEGGIVDGEVDMRVKIGPLWVKMLMQHCEYKKNSKFKDVQIEGPFPMWEHTHLFNETKKGFTKMNDIIDCRIPLGLVGKIFSRKYVKNRIEQLLEYRHSTVYEDFKIANKYRGKTMNVGITGSHGLIGTALIPFLTTCGHKVTRIVRGTPKENEIYWNPKTGEIDSLEGLDIIVHLAGEPVGSRIRWNRKKKEEIYESRVLGTGLLCRKISRMVKPVKALISASAVGYYGDRGNEFLDETSGAGGGFFSDVVKGWEKATEYASGIGIRTVNMRFGIVLTPEGGALERMMLPVNFGLGSRIGGEQWWSWVSIDDTIGSIYHAMMNDEMKGKYNVTAPFPVRQKEFSKTLCGIMWRPDMMALPESIVKNIMGEMGEMLLLASNKINSNKIIETGYEFRHERLEDALRHLLGKREIIESE